VCLYEVINLFQKPLGNSGGNPCRVALRRSAFWRKRRFYFLAVSPERSEGYNNFFGIGSSAQGVLRNYAIPFCHDIQYL